MTSGLQTNGQNPAVLVDLRWAQGRPAGTGAYTRDLAVALSQHLPVLGLVKPGAALSEVPFPIAILPAKPKGRFDAEQTLLARRTGAWLISISRVPALLIPEQAISMILDLTPLLYGHTHPAIRVALERLTYPVAARAGTIVTLSNTSARDLMLHLSIPAGKLCTVRPGVSAMAEPAPPERLGELGITGKFVLAVGTLEPRKNLSLLVELFARRLQDLPLQLVFAGNLGWKYARLLQQMAPLQQSGKLVHLGYVSEAEKALLYQRAVCLAFPSFYEGFGLPILEAMVQGTPVIVSSAPACVEVAGSAGIIVDPRDIDGWADAISSLYRGGNLRAELGRAGQERARQFSWQQSILPLVERLKSSETAVAA